MHETTKRLMALIAAMEAERSEIESMLHIRQKDLETLPERLRGTPEYDGISSDITLLTTVCGRLDRVLADLSTLKGA